MKSVLRTSRSHAGVGAAGTRSDRRDKRERKDEDGALGFTLNRKKGFRRSNPNCQMRIGQHVDCKDTHKPNTKDGGNDGTKKPGYIPRGIAIIL